MQKACLFHRAFWPGYLAAIVVLLATTLPVSLSAQIPDEFTNLQILDKGIKKGELIGVMKGFTRALGARCNHCHVGLASGSLEGMDFASDEKDTKKTTRLMLRMTAAINAEHISKVEGSSQTGVKVQCVTCHRGQAHPRMIEDVLKEAHAQGGFETTEAVYDSLRNQYYGSHTFDFDFSMLTSFAEDLAREEKLDDAIRVLKLNEKHNPDQSWNYAMLGRIYMQMGENESAIASFRKVLELDPDSRGARQMLKRLEGK